MLKKSGIDAFVNKRLTLPALPDEEQAETARFLIVFAWLNILIVPIGILAAVAAAPVQSVRALVGTVAVVLTFLGVIALVKHGRVKGASYLVLGLLWLLTTLFAGTGGGVYAPVYSGYFVIAFLAGILLGARALVLMAALCILSGLLLVFGAQADLLPAVRPVGAPHFYWVVVSTFMLILAFLQYYSQRRTKHSLERAHQAQAALAAKEEIHSSLLASLDSVVSSVDADGRFLYLNEMAARQLGAPVADLLGKTLQELFPAPVAAKQLEHVRQVIREDRPLVSEALIVVQGRARWHRTAIQPVHDLAGRVLYALINSTDIHELKTAEDSALYRQQRLEQVIQLGKRIAAITDLKACLYEVYQSIQRELQFDRVGLFLYDHTTQTAQGVFGADRHGAQEDTSWYRTSVAHWWIWSDALQSPGGFSLIEDYQASVDPPPESDMYGVKQYLTMAAWVGERPVAMIAVDNLISQRVINSADVEALQLLAGYVGLAIENARLNADLEQCVRERTAEVQDLYDNAPAGYHSLDAAGTITAMNQTELTWLGYAREEVVGVKTIFQLLTPASAQKLTAVFPQYLQQGGINDLECDFVRKDGSILPTIGNVTAIFDAQGTYLASRSTIFDNTERKQTEAALRASEATYRALFENSNDGIFLMSPEGRELTANQHALDLLGYTAEEYLALHERQINAIVTDPDQRADADERFAAVLRGERIPLYERWLTTKDGRRVPVEINLSPVRDESGQVIMVQSVVRDVTERKAHEDALRLNRDQLSAANAALLKASQAKNEFLANMSHELRTPLNGILGAAEILLAEFRGPLTDPQRAMVNAIDTSGSHLLSLINDILDLSKIEAGRLEVHLEPVILADVCMASLAFVKEPALKKDIAVTFVPDPAVTTVMADMRRLKQILVNLLSNAVKFTPACGKVTLQVQANVEQRAVELAVIDTGIGIAPEDLRRLFNPFTQVDSSLTRQHEGTGLGLALVKELTELHGGRVQVTSAPGQGSTFTVVLPWQPAATNAAPALRAELATDTAAPVQAVQSAAATILLADDIELNSSVIGDYLASLGYHVVFAVNGREAIEQARAHEPALILMDVQMPEMDGLEAMRRLRATPRFATVPIIAVTSLAMAGDRERCLAAGATAYVSKPVGLRMLAELIGKLLDANTAEAVAAHC